MPKLGLGCLMPPTDPTAPIPDDWQECDAIGSYYDAIAAIGRQVKHEGRELPDTFVPKAKRGGSMMGAIPPTCALPGCDKPLRRPRPARYCSREHAVEADRLSDLARRGRSRAAVEPPPAPVRICARDGCDNEVSPLRSLQAIYCSSLCNRLHHKAAKRQQRIAPDAAAPESAPPYDARQAPLRPRWRLEFHPDIKILPPRPAPLKVHRTGPRAGRPTRFQDDLGAIYDRGSPSHQMPAKASGYSYSASPLGALCRR